MSSYIGNSILNAMRLIKSGPDETAEELAARMYAVQMEIYAAHAGRDLGGSLEDFLSLPQVVREDWIEKARKHKEFTGLQEQACRERKQGGPCG